MAAVGLSDVFKYGGTFLGYLVAVAVAGVVFVGGGAYFATTGGLNVLSPSLDALTTGRAIAGAVLVVLGVVISLSGLIGLLHKLLADAAAAALESARPPRQDAVAAQDSESEDDEEAADDVSEGSSVDTDLPVDGDEPAVAEDGAETPLDGEDTTGTVTEEPEPGRPVDDATPSEEPPVANGEPESGPASGANPVAEAAADHGEASPPRETPPAPPDQPTGDQMAEQTDSGDFVDESATDEAWTESKYATGVDDAPTQDATSGADAQEPSDDAEDDDTDRTEWTPPDPAEFEQSTASTEEGIPEQTDPEPSDSTAQTTSENVVTDVQAESQSDEDVRTWDDVQSASSGNNIETEENTVDSTDSDPFAEPGDETPGVADAEGTTDDPLGANEPNFADEQPTSAATGDEATSLGDEMDPGEIAQEDELDELDENDGEDEDEEDEEDLTLADEGASSFDPKADDDPLGDRLSGGDD